MAELGYSTSGGSSDGAANTVAIGCYATASGSGTGNQIHVTCQNTDAATDLHLKVALYSDSAGNNRPNAKLLSEVTMTFPANQTTTQVAAYAVSIVDGTKYWFVMMNDSADQKCKVLYDAGAANQQFYLIGQTYAAFAPDPFVSVTGNGTNKYSVWIDYTVTGSGTMAVLSASYRRRRG